MEKETKEKGISGTAQVKLTTDNIHLLKLAGSDIGVNTTQYADGDLVGGKLTITDVIPYRKGGVLQSVVLHDLDAQDAALVLILWDLNPTSTTFTNNSTLDVADADLPNVIAKIKIAAGDYDDFSDNSIGQVDNLSIPLKGSRGILYGAIVSDAATPTYSANGLSMCLSLLVDEV